MTASAICTYGATLLRVDEVHLELGGKTILRDVNLEIKDIIIPGRTTGQVVGLLGPSGIGKTQLFRIMAGLNEPTRGRVLIGERACLVERGMVGVVSQSYPLFNHRTVLGNLVVAGGRAGLSADAARTKARELLERFNLAEHEKKYPVQLSGGQRQRVAIAQQFMCSEHYLLMDEPFSGLDPIAVDRVSAFVTEVANAHELNTIIVVTHDITAAMTVADTLWLLGRDRDEKGNIIPGARVQATYNLIEKGLAYRTGITSTPEFLALQGEIRARYASL
ncbi:MAG TPA: ATP-binding cassette domain-containing protein [Thermoanaerobaculia bacterium]|nr:ATP-binding cassette domain-containing protein [Thermoanaerobaculia bacterium]